MNKDVGYLLKIITDKLKVKSDITLKKYDLTFVQSKVIAFLVEKNNKASQKEIENFLEVAHSTVVGIISRMVQKGFLIVYVDETDKRNNIICLTDKAILLWQALKKEIKESENRMLKDFSKQQKFDLINNLIQIYENLDY